MIEFGETLRKARETKGLTPRQIADSTHMLIQTVEDLENENFSRIAAPIYGRGFVKLYCEEVGIDPKPLIAEFMDIFNGNRTPTIRMRTVAPAEPEPSVPERQAPVPAPAPDSAPEPPAAEPDFFRLESEPAPSRRAETPPPPAFVSRGPSRYAAPMPIDEKPSPSRIRVPIPPSVWRLATLASAAGLILWMLWFGARALYNATMTPERPPPARDAAAPASAPDDGKPSESGRKPLSMPPLYID